MRPLQAVTFDDDPGLRHRTDEGVPPAPVVAHLCRIIAADKEEVRALPPGGG